MSTWQVRQEGAPTATTLASAADVINGLRDGVWLPTDEVKGPTDAGFRPIEAHPAFEEAADELEHPPVEGADETHLDMNPLIDVCLVLLIFFILTITYDSLRRSIDLPQELSDEKNKATRIDPKEMKDQVIRVICRMDGNKPVVKVEDKEVAVEEIDAEIKAAVDKTGRKQLFLDVDGAVPWGVQTAVLDAAKANKIYEVLYRPKPKPGR